MEASKESIVKGGTGNQAELMVLGQMNDSLRTLQIDMREVRDKVIKLENQNFEGRLTAVATTIDRIVERIDKLESDRDQRTGMTNLAGWFIKNTPWLIGASTYLISLYLKSHHLI